MLHDTTTKRCSQGGGGASTFWWWLSFQCLLVVLAAAASTSTSALRRREQDMAAEDERHYYSTTITTSNSNNNNNDQDHQDVSSRLVVHGDTNRNLFTGSSQHDHNNNDGDHHDHRSLEDGEIINGDDVQQELSWFVSFFLGNCAGALVSSNMVVTAAHCVDGTGDEGCPAQVRIGSLFRREQGIVVDVECGSCDIHPEYGKEPNRFDIATFKLATVVAKDAITLNDRAALPATGDRVAAYGFGIFQNNVTDPDRSEILKAKTQDYDGPCATLGASYVPEIQMCSTNENAVCQGDSGGPLVYWSESTGSTGTRIPVLVGIASFIGSRDSGNCGKVNESDVWTRVSYFQQWIDERIQARNAGCGGTNAVARVYRSAKNLARAAGTRLRQYLRNTNNLEW